MTKFNHTDPSLAFVPKCTPTLADIIAMVTDTPDVAETRRRDLLSDLRSFARMVDLPEDRILADPPWLRQRVAGISCKAEGVSRKRLSNILSNVRAALRMFGIDMMGRRQQAGLIPEWLAIWRPVRGASDHALRNGLSRGVHFASNHGVLPHEVDDAFVAFFLSALEASEVHGRPNTIVRGFVRMWNRARTERRDWPKQVLSAPKRRGVYSLPWDELPPSLLAQTHAFLHRAPSDDIFDLSAPDRALSPATIEHREGQIRRAASILVHLGNHPMLISTLPDLIADKNAEQILRWMLERNGGEASGAIGGMAQMLSTVALHVEDEAAYEQCRTYAKRLTPQRHGMGEKNIARLRPFEDNAEVRRLLDLPEVLVRRAQGEVDPYRAALLVESALLINLLTYCPIRAKNLTSIRLDRHLVRVKGGRRQLHLVIPFAETKNRQPLEFPLQDATVLLLDLFVSDHRPHLVQHDGPYLFSQRARNAPLSRATLRSQITKRIHGETGNVVHPHLFRHLSAKIFLTVNPGQYEVVRRMLGHKALSSALDQYTGIETDAANRAYAKLLDSLKKKGQS